MATTITINSITGASPFDVYLCDYPTTICIYIDTINTVPYTFNVPPAMESQTSFVLKIIDSTVEQIKINSEINAQLLNNQPLPKFMRKYSSVFLKISTIMDGSLNLFSGYN